MTQKSWIMNQKWFRPLLCVLLIAYIYLWWFALTNYESRLRVTTLDYSQVMLLNTGLSKKETPYCYVDINKLGKVDVDLFRNLTMEDVERSYPDTKLGGQWAPRGCKSLQRVAIIVPYRDRYHHLVHLLNRLHAMLPRQQIEYRVFLLEQVSPDQFNRGMLMNIGYAEAQKHGPFHCFIFHDTDLYPTNDRNLYLCDEEVRHLSAAIDETRFHVRYYNYLGGVSALSSENVVKVNGFSNLYWGWGSEDNDFSARTQEAGLAITRPPMSVALFKMARHVKADAGEYRFDLFVSWQSRWKKDGLNSLSSLDFTTKTSNHKLYTNISVDLGQLPDRRLIDQSQVISWYWFFNFYGYLPTCNKPLC